MHKDLYKRPNKPKRMTVPGYEVPTRAPQLTVPEIPTVHASTECHVTPEAAAKKMVHYLELVEGDTLLEPNAGTGALIAATVEEEPELNTIYGVELQQSLFEITAGRFENSPSVKLTLGCFLELAPTFEGKNVSKILMNPPFRAAKQHFAAALKVLQASSAVDRSLVALVPNAFDHPDAYELERLGPETFALAKVHTKIIRVDL